MNNEVHDHFVVEKHDSCWYVISEFFLNSLDFSIPGVDMGSTDGLEDEVVEGLISLGGGWVLWGAHVFVMALEMLVKEMGVHELSVSPGSSNLVAHFAFVEELVSTNGVKTAEVAPLEAE
jgi:hypothetical protein